MLRVVWFLLQETQCPRETYFRHSCRLPEDKSVLQTKQSDNNFRQPLKLV